MTTPNYKGTNTGHGHVWARPDGVKARCGGLGLCSVCNRDATAILAMCSTPAPTTDERAKLAEEVKRLAAEYYSTVGWDKSKLPTAREKLHAAIDRLAAPPAPTLEGKPRRADYVNAARIFAKAYGLHGDAPAYLPRTAEEAERFEPHAWVVAAMMQAYADGQWNAPPAPPSHDTYVLQLLIAGGHVTVNQVRSAREIAARVCPAPDTEASARRAAQAENADLKGEVVRLRSKLAHCEGLRNEGARVPLTDEQRKEIFATHLLHTTADGGELYDVELIAADIERAHGIGDAT